MIDFLLKTFLFCDIEKTDYLNLINDCNFYEIEFQKGDVICSEHSDNNRIGFVKSGECTVFRQHIDNTLTPLNTVKPNSSFGIISVFDGCNDFPTTIIAKKQSVVVFIDKEHLLSLMMKDPRISFNVAKFLAGRVVFLNNKIKAFSGSSVTEKLACYLLSESDNLDSVTFDLNAKKTAEALNIGRASLYRAIQNLVNENLINYVDNKIYIIDPEGLRRKK